jgi:pyrimidine operon attenuation protein/uracil phosphoribosyltransferase
MRSVLGAEEIARALRRLTGEIAERTKGARGVTLVGIRRGGVPLAARIRGLLKEVEGLDVPVGTVDITLYRDDAATALPNPRIGRSELPLSLEGNTVILVDDVLFTGRTIRAAIDALFDCGRPAAIQLAVLIDRGHRELPIQADYVGRQITTKREEIVDVLLDRDDGAPDEVMVR